MTRCDASFADDVAEGLPACAVEFYELYLIVTPIVGRARIKLDARQQPYSEGGRRRSSARCVNSVSGQRRGSQGPDHWPGAGKTLELLGISEPCCPTSNSTARLKYTLTAERSYLEKRVCRTPIRMAQRTALRSKSVRSGRIRSPASKPRLSSFHTKTKNGARLLRVPFWARAGGHPEFWFWHRPARCSRGEQTPEHRMRTGFQ